MADIQQQEIRFNPELLTRCVEYVEGWFDVDHESILSGETQLPDEVKGIHIDIHNALFEKEFVSDETLSAVGFKAIVAAQQAKEPEVLSPTRKKRSFGLVPRLVESTVS